uniref:Putative secreted protein n=1 Tax=Anopheles darlingi TaxID=43151 RepID=A0A2M4D2I4_ANODA
MFCAGTDRPTDGLARSLAHTRALLLVTLFLFVPNTPSRVPLSVVHTFVRLLCSSFFTSLHNPKGGESMRAYGCIAGSPSPHLSLYATPRGNAIPKRGSSISWQVAMRWPQFLKGDNAPTTMRRIFFEGLLAGLCAGSHQMDRWECTGALSFLSYPGSSAANGANETKAKNVPLTKK